MPELTETPVTGSADSGPTAEPADSLHSCSWHCDRPGCIRAQRDALRQRIAELEADAERLDWLGSNPRLAEITTEAGTKDCYYYAVAGAPGLTLREIIDAARKS